MRRADHGSTSTGRVLAMLRGWTILAALGLAGCGGGGGDSGSAGSSTGASAPVASGTVAPALPAPSSTGPIDQVATTPASSADVFVRLAFDTSTTAPGRGATLRWTSNADVCTASGAWSGAQQANGSATVRPTDGGMYSYQLTCTTNGKVAYAAALLPVTDDGSNLLPVRVEGRRSVLQKVSNLPFVSVTLCNPGGDSCQSIDRVLLDTGSTGLQIVSPEVLPPALNLPNVMSANGKPLRHCTQFGDTTALFGSLRKATVKIGEQTVPDLVVKVAGDSDVDPSVVDDTCPGLHPRSATAFGANAVLGIGTSLADCNDCVTNLKQSTYSECGTDCQPASVTQAMLLKNPAAQFAQNNNGFSVVLPPVPASGATALAGVVRFGIGTRPDNGLGKAVVLDALNPYGTVYTDYGGLRKASFFDTGTNHISFSDKFLPQCFYSRVFYCPSSDSKRSADVVSASGTSLTLDFVVKNVDALSPLVAAAGTGAFVPNSGLSSMFIWGLPAFFGRTITFGIDQAKAGSLTGPFIAIGT